MRDELKKTMKTLVKFAIESGADQCDVILSKGDSFSLSAQKGAIDKYQVSGSQVMGLRAITNKRVGLAYTESTDIDSLKRAASSAVENAKNSEQNPFEEITVHDSEMIKESQFSAEDISVEEKINFCLQLESEVKAKDSRVTATPYNGYSESSFEKHYMNSLGTYTFGSEYYLSCYTSALMNEKDKSAMHYHSSMARKFNELNAKECIDESLFHASRWLEAAPLKTGKYDVIFSTNLFSNVFNCFTNIFSGKSAMEKTNPFADKLNKKVMNEKIIISDLPGYEDAFFKSHFDSEGRAHKDLVLVENGVLKSFYHNTATANYFGVESTAHGARGAKSPLGVAGSTRVISAGDIADEMILGGVYFEVHELSGLHSGANAISGDFSFGASGYLVRDGEKVQAVRGVTISGNFHKMLLDINKIGDTIHATSDKSFFAPVFRFEQMSIAGA